MNKSISYIILLIAFPFYFTGCKKEVRPTSMTIKDSIRHYYPIKQGQQLELMFTITNTGDHKSFQRYNLPADASYSTKVRTSLYRKTASDNSKPPTTVLRT